MKKPPQPPRGASQEASKVRTAAELSNAPESNVEKPATAPPIDSEIAAAAGKLVLLCGAARSRRDEWLQKMRLEPETVEKIASIYRDTFGIEYNTIPGHWRFRIWLLEKPEPIRHAPVIQKAPQPPEKL